MCSNETSSEDENFVELFKKEHNEQFYVLVKMHLSFLLHMTTEESECFYEKVKLRKWSLVSFGKKSKQRSISEVASLNQETLNQLHQLINFIKDDKNLKTEGIFRRTGSLERQNDLKVLLTLGQKINFNENCFTVHDCASVLKGFLADLPEPLSTDIQFPVYCQIAESYKTDIASHEIKILQSVQLLFLLLPKENKHLLKDIFELLYKVTLCEKENKMSAENLAKLFTPHLLCPRKLAPEMLLKDSQTLFGVVAFMIKHFHELFKIPSQLLLDFRTHYEQGSVLNESVKGAAHTVFTFVDNKLTAKENEENVTETALAQLYAHIQSLPESSKKRKLVKQFNKENGQGTPLQVIRSSVPKNKSFGDSIKKHMFHKKLLKNVKKSGFSQLKSASSDEVLNETMMTPRSRKPVLLISGTNLNTLGKATPTLSHLQEEEFIRGSSNVTPNNSSCLIHGETTGDTILESSFRKRTHYNPDFGPESSRKAFVKSKSDGDLINDQKLTDKQPKMNKTDSPAVLSNTFKRYLNSREILTFDSPTDSSFSSRSDDFQSYSELHNECSRNMSDDMDVCNGKMSDSMMYVLNGNNPDEDDSSAGEKKLVLKPRQFDENGMPIVFETSF